MTTTLWVELFETSTLMWRRWEKSCWEIHMALCAGQRPPRRPLLLEVAYMAMIQHQPNHIDLFREVNDSQPIEGIDRSCRIEDVTRDPTPNHEDFGFPRPRPGDVHRRGEMANVRLGLMVEEIRGLVGRWRLKWFHFFSAYRTKLTKTLRAPFLPRDGD